jgi:predicted outer membrane repeat protein
VTIVDSEVSRNIAGEDGGGISNYGTMEIRHSAVSGNLVNFLPSRVPGTGGGISNAGALEISDTMIIGNTGGTGGGGILNSGPMTITGSTVGYNTVLGFGGGIENLGTLEIRNSTISGNAANSKQGGEGGGIYNGGALTITNSTVSNNSADHDGGGISSGSGTLQIGNTILKAGANGANIHHGSGTITSHGYNLSSDDGGGFLTATGDQINIDPMLTGLGSNGGPTWTEGLQSGSPAINAGDPNFTPPPLYDQRGLGYPRVIGGRMDVGSFESQP